MILPRERNPRLPSFLPPTLSQISTCPNMIIAIVVVVVTTIDIITSIAIFIVTIAIITITFLQLEFTFNAYQSFWNIPETKFFSWMKIAFPDLFAAGNGMGAIVMKKMKRNPSVLDRRCGINWHQRLDRQSLVTQAGAFVSVLFFFDPFWLQLYCQLSYLVEFV